jgi:signal transduction histidine kinase
MPRLRFLALYVLAWLPFAGLYALALVVQRSTTLGDALAATVGSVLPAMLLGLAAWWGAARLQGARWPRAAQLAAHALLAVVYSGLWLGSTAAQIAAFAPPEALAFYLRFSVGWQLLMGVVSYAAIVGAAVTIGALRRVQEREAAAARAETQRARAELHALRARLDPHFLFNTLHSVSVLVRDDPPAAERALEWMAELLRYVLDAERRGSDDVALAEELAFVRTYLALERLRLGERLHVEEAVEADALDCSVPALTLQPLVENAVRHGLAPVARGGTLRIAAAVDGDRLRLEVRDDGAGAAAAAAARREGIGLATVRQRLLARYPGAAAVDVVTAPGEGFAVRLVLPAVAHDAALPSPSRARASEEAGVVRA